MKLHPGLLLVSSIALVSCSSPAPEPPVPATSKPATPAVTTTVEAPKPGPLGYVTTPSGLRYKEITPGTGGRPGPASTVTVHYRGTLLDGTVFDSSYERGEPTTFPLNGVIPGWTEGLQLMQPGAKYEFVIPPNLAYGERGAPPSIGPNETLKFVVELLQVQ